MRLPLRKELVILALLLLVILTQAAAFFFSHSSDQKISSSLAKEEFLQQSAKQVLAACASSSYRPACYDEEIPKLMDSVSMEQAFQITKFVQEEDNEYWYCHVLGHNLSSKETAKDPAKWKDVVARCPSGMCSNGCIHGAFQERFRAEALPDAEIQELKPELEGICEQRRNWKPTGLEQATCVHALGHLIMYITAADIHKSTRLCEELTTDVDGRNFSQLCFDGAFMQIFQPLEPEDFALIEGKQPTKEKLPAFCDQFTGQKRSSCWTEGWPLSFQQVQMPEGLVQYCSFLKDDDSQYNRCYEALVYVLTAQFRFDEDKLLNFCGGLPQERKGQCFANVASRFIETDARLIDKSVRMCAAAQNFGVEDRCYEELLFYSTYNFHPGSEEFLHLCSRLPQLWKTRCLAGGNTPR